jgi:hypothetical protein
MTAVLFAVQMRYYAPTATTARTVTGSTGVRIAEEAKIAAYVKIDMY